MQPKEAQTRTHSESELFEVHRWVSLLAVSPKIILPKDWYVVLATNLDSTDPEILPTFVYGIDMTLQTVVVGKSLFAYATTEARGTIVLRARWCFG
jgi:hypothetical protein